jgi:O-antigen/teichoic acid export membrane protein
VRHDAPVSIQRDTLWNGAGALVPAVVAVAVVPSLTQSLGPEGFSLLAIAWALVGWFTVADLGLSRGVTQGVAQALAAGAPDQAAARTWTAMRYMTGASLVAALGLWALAPWLVAQLQLPVARGAEAERALRWTAAALPPTVGMLAWRGVLEGCHAFRAAALLRIPLGVAFAVVPWLMATRGYGLVGAIQGIAAVRLVGWGVHAAVAVRVLPTLRKLAEAEPSDRAALLAFGGWSTVSNVVSPLMNTVDRVGMGALIPVALLAPYAVATELATKSWLLTASVVPVYYPRFARALPHAPSSAINHLLQGCRQLTALSLPALVVMVALAEPALAWWIGPPLAAQAARAMQWLAIGLASNLATAQLHLALVQAAGRPAYAAWGHLVELPLFAAGLWWAVPRYGAEGAAVVWALRMLVDAGWLLVMAERAVPEARTVRGAVVTMAAGGTTLLLLVLGLARTVHPLAALVAGLGLALTALLKLSGSWRLQAAPDAG